MAEEKFGKKSFDEMEFSAGVLAANANRIKPKITGLCFIKDHKKMCMDWGNFTQPLWFEGYILASAGLE